MQYWTFDCAIETAWLLVQSEIDALETAIEDVRREQRAAAAEAAGDACVYIASSMSHGSASLRISNQRLSTSGPKKAVECMCINDCLCPVALTSLHCR